MLGVPQIRYGSALGWLCPRQGRRATVGFGDSSGEAFAYDSADRLTSLAHGFPNAPDDVTLTYAYDDAGRGTAKSFSSPAYALTGAVTGTRSYTALFGFAD
ncbi:MAG: hypothetical protein ACRED8_09380 [Caulobacteraceae bacterium]